MTEDEWLQKIAADLSAVLKLRDASYDPELKNYTVSIWDAAYQVVPGPSKYNTMIRNVLVYHAGELLDILEK
jgi:hypothetical protein